MIQRPRPERDVTREISARPSAIPDRDVIEIGPLRLEPESFTVSVDGQNLSLTLTEFLLLQEFARHPYQVLDRARLAALVHEAGGTFIRNTASSRAVDTHIARLRAKLRGAGYDCIKTMRFVGYRFVPIP